MKIIKVAFTDDEKKSIRDLIVSSSTTDDRVYETMGYEFGFSRKHLSFLDDFILYVLLELMDEPEYNEAPDTPKIKSRSVIRFKIDLCDDGEELETNLDYNFEESVKNELTI